MWHHSTCLWAELSSVELSWVCFSLAWVDSLLAVINIFWLILCELIAKRENGREGEREKPTAARLHCGTEHCPCSTTTPISSCLPPPSFAPFACSCQRLKTRFSDFHVACWQWQWQRSRQRSLKFMQNVLLHCGGNSIRPPLPSYPSPTSRTTTRNSIKVKFRLQVQVSPRWGSFLYWFVFCVL